MDFATTTTQEFGTSALSESVLNDVAVDDTTPPLAAQDSSLGRDDEHHNEALASLPGPQAIQAQGHGGHHRQEAQSVPQPAPAPQPQWQQRGAPSRYGPAQPATAPMSPPPPSSYAPAPTARGVAALSTTPQFAHKGQVGSMLNGPQRPTRAKAKLETSNVVVLGSFTLLGFANMGLAIGGLIASVYAMREGMKKPAQTIVAMGCLALNVVAIVIHLTR